MIESSSNTRSSQIYFRAIRTLISQGKQYILTKGIKLTEEDRLVEDKQNEAEYTCVRTILRQGKKERNSSAT